MPKIVRADVWGNVEFEDGTLGKVKVTKSDDHKVLIGREKATVVLIP